MLSYTRTRRYSPPLTPSNSARLNNPRRFVPPGEESNPYPNRRIFFASSILPPLPPRCSSYRRVTVPSGRKRR
jgi:hypothetical protein